MSKYFSSDPEPEDSSDDSSLGSPVARRDNNVPPSAVGISAGNHSSPSNHSSEPEHLSTVDENQEETSPNTRFNFDSSSSEDENEEAQPSTARTLQFDNISSTQHQQERVRVVLEEQTEIPVLLSTNPDSECKGYRGRPDVDSIMVLTNSFRDLGIVFSNDQWSIHMELNLSRTHTNNRSRVILLTQNYIRQADLPFQPTFRRCKPTFIKLDDFPSLKIAEIRGTVFGSNFNCMQYDIYLHILENECVPDDGYFTNIQMACVIAALELSTRYSYEIERLTNRSRMGRDLNKMSKEEKFDMEMQFANMMSFRKKPEKDPMFENSRIAKKVFNGTQLSRVLHYLEYAMQLLGSNLDSLTPETKLGLTAAINMNSSERIELESLKETCRYISRNKMIECKAVNLKHIYKTYKADWFKRKFSKEIPFGRGSGNRPQRDFIQYLNDHAMPDIDADVRKLFIPEQSQTKSIKDCPHVLVGVDVGFELYPSDDREKYMFLWSTDEIDGLKNTLLSKRFSTREPTKSLNGDYYNFGEQHLSSRSTNLIPKRSHFVYPTLGCSGICFSTNPRFFVEVGHFSGDSTQAFAEVKICRIPKKNEKLVIQGCQLYHPFTMDGQPYEQSCRTLSSHMMSFLEASSGKNSLLPLQTVFEKLTKQCSMIHDGIEHVLKSVKDKRNKAVRFEAYLDLHYAKDDPIRPLSLPSTSEKVQECIFVVKKSKLEKYLETYLNQNFGNQKLLKEVFHRKAKMQPTLERFRKVKPETKMSTILSAQAACVFVGSLKWEPTLFKKFRDKNPALIPLQLPNQEKLVIPMYDRDVTGLLYGARPTVFVPSYVHPRQYTSRILRSPDCVLPYTIEAVKKSNRFYLPKTTVVTHAIVWNLVMMMCDPHYRQSLCREENYDPTIFTDEEIERDEVGNGIINQTILSPSEPQNNNAPPESSDNRQDNTDVGQDFDIDPNEETAVMGKCTISEISKFNFDILENNTNDTVRKYQNSILLFSKMMFTGTDLENMEDPNFRSSTEQRSLPQESDNSPEPMNSPFHQIDFNALLNLDEIQQKKLYYSVCLQISRSYDAHRHCSMVKSNKFPSHQQMITTDKDVRSPALPRTIYRRPGKVSDVRRRIYTPQQLMFYVAGPLDTGDDILSSGWKKDGTRFVIKEVLLLINRIASLRLEKTKNDPNADERLIEWKEEDFFNMMYSVFSGRVRRRNTSHLPIVWHAQATHMIPAGKEYIAHVISTRVVFDDEREVTTSQSTTYASTFQYAPLVAKMNKSKYNDRKWKELVERDGKSLVNVLIGKAFFVATTKMISEATWDNTIRHRSKDFCLVRQIGSIPIPRTGGRIENLFGSVSSLTNTVSSVLGSIGVSQDFSMIELSESYANYPEYRAILGGLGINTTGWRDYLRMYSQKCREEGAGCLVPDHADFDVVPADQRVINIPLTEKIGMVGNADPPLPGQKGSEVWYQECLAKAVNEGRIDETFLSQVYDDRQLWFKTWERSFLSSAKPEFWPHQIIEMYHRCGHTNPEDKGRKRTAEILYVPRTPTTTFPSTSAAPIESGGNGMPPSNTSTKSRSAQKFQPEIEDNIAQAEKRVEWVREEEMKRYKKILTVEEALKIDEESNTQRKFFIYEECKTLLEEVKVLGLGKWSKILKKHQQVFRRRDKGERLKDCWYNLRKKRDEYGNPL